MSLQLAAQHLASKGRGPDRMLVHMTPGEVQSLQAVAMAHGGSLTINPETGLPEAGFLSSILPMIAGVGLTALSGGTLSPMMAGLLTGGGTALATGNLRKGIMAGLGAYGGAGLGSSLAGAGAQEAMLQANPGLTAGEIAREMGTPGFVQPSMTDKMMAGFKGLGSEAGRDTFMQQVGGGKGLMKYGATALSPALMAQSGETAQRPSTGSPYSFEFDAGATGATPDRNTGEGRYFAPRLRRMADGGSTGMTGESDAYYRYLMGLAPAPTPAVYAAPTSYSGSPASSISEALAPSAQLMGGNSRPYYGEPGPETEVNDPNAWGNLTPDQKAEYFEQHPTFGNIHGFLVSALGNTIPGQIIQALNPAGYGNELTLSMGLPPSIYGPMAAQNGSDIGAHPGLGFGSGIGAANVPGGANFGADLGYDNPTEGDTSAPTGADNEDAGMGAAIAAADNVSIGDAIAGVTAGDVAAAADAAAAADGGGDDYAYGGMTTFAQGGYNLGDYSDGGRLLRGPGDGVSDSIPASIANKRPARLADGEFVIPARIVSELGNGSTEAGARKLYAMMDRVQSNRSKTTGKGRVAVNSRSDKYLPA